MKKQKITLIMMAILLIIAIIVTILLINKPKQLPDIKNEDIITSIQTEKDYNEFNNKIKDIDNADKFNDLFTEKRKDEQGNEQTTLNFFDEDVVIEYNEQSILIKSEYRNQHYSYEEDDSGNMQFKANKDDENFYAKLNEDYEKIQKIIEMESAQSNTIVSYSFINKKQVYVSFESDALKDIIEEMMEDNIFDLNPEAPAKIEILIMQDNDKIVIEFHNVGLFAYNFSINYLKD